MQANLTRICRHCNREMAIRHFRFHHGRYCWQCDDCRKASCKAYRQTDAAKKKLKIRMKKVRATQIYKDKKNKRYRERYAKDEVFREKRIAIAVHSASLLSAKPRIKKAMARYMANHPERTRARRKVTNAITSGKMPPASAKNCVECGKQAREYHHHNGYGNEHQLDAIPVCKPCHYKLDRKDYSSNRPASISFHKDL